MLSERLLSDTAGSCVLLMVKALATNIYSSLEKGVKYVQSLQKTPEDVIEVVLVFLLLTLNIFQTFF